MSKTEPAAGNNSGSTDEPAWPTNLEIRAVTKVLADLDLLFSVEHDGTNTFWSLEFPSEDSQTVTVSVYLFLEQVFAAHDFEPRDLTIEQMRRLLELNIFITGPRVALADKTLSVVKAFPFRHLNAIDLQNAIGSVLEGIDAVRKVVGPAPPASAV